jgi:hypothetical protein
MHRDHYCTGNPHTAIKARCRAQCVQPWVMHLHLYRCLSAHCLVAMTWELSLPPWFEPASCLLWLINWPCRTVVCARPFLGVQQHGLLGLCALQLAQASSSFLSIAVSQASRQLPAHNHVSPQPMCRKRLYHHHCTNMHSALSSPSFCVCLLCVWFCPSVVTAGGCSHAVSYSIMRVVSATAT